MFDLHKVGQCHGVQFSQCHSMINIKIYKVVPCNFALALAVSEILTFQIFDLQEVGQGHGVQFSH